MATYCCTIDSAAFALGVRTRQQSGSNQRDQHGHPNRCQQRDKRQLNISEHQRLAREEHDPEARDHVSRASNDAHWARVA